VSGDGGEWIAEVTREGLGAALAVAHAQGLPVGDPEVLSSRGNVLVHLRPAPVVARVATLTAWTRSDPFQWLAREVAVAGYAAAHGGPVVAPTALADPGPHRSNGRAVSLWTFVPPSPEHPERPEPAEFGVALARLHIATSGFRGELPVLATLREQISDALDALERERVLEPGVLAALRDRHAEILAGLDGVSLPDSVLHGDAHPGNLLWSDAGWLWTDLEETCRGPHAFDLAVLVRGQDAADAATALAAYADVTGEPLPGPGELAWFDWARALEGAVWVLAMAHQYPARYAEWAPTLLANVLAARRPSPGPGQGRTMGT
jgi:Ser/Thr protein kinase RdoA (MazF antagonist)